jgi:hypothetical protein
MAMKTIWKFPLEITDRPNIPMPGGAEVLSVQVQNGNPCIWAIVNPESPPAARQFRILGTGHPIENLSLSTDIFIGTFQLPSYGLVFHLFEMLED